MRFLACVLLTLTACAQSIMLRPPPVPVVVNLPAPFIESFPASAFAAPNSPVNLSHVPDLGSIVRVTMKGSNLFLDQTTVKKTEAPLTLTIDQSELTVGAVVTFEYYSSH